MGSYNLSVDIDWIINPFQHTLLIDYVSKKFKECENIIFIDCHHNIINHLPKNNISLVNIDHHHDITNDSEYQNKNKLNEGNWVSYLAYKNYLQDYIWINNISSLIDDLVISNGGIRNLKTFKIEHSLDFIKDFKYKKIVICKSREFSWENGYSECVISFNILKSIAKNFFKEKTIVDNESNPYRYYN